MAGLGFKDFQVGEVLTSSDVDGYLMQQSVMRFADSGARGSALGTAPGTAVPLAEGMVAFLDDTNVVEVYNGTAWTPVSGVIQTVFASGTATVQGGSTSFVDSGVEVSITPKFSTSDIYVFGQVEKMYADTGTTTLAYVTLFRDSTELAASAQINGTFGEGGTSGGAALMILDSPSTTSSVTYKIRQQRQGATGTIGTSGNKNLIVMEVNGV